MNCFRPGTILAVALFLLSSQTFAGTPIAAITASPIQGNAPLTTFFDGTSSSPDVTTYLWVFGDGAASTAAKISHTYTVAGQYVATLTVGNASNQTATSQILIVVTGSGQGPITQNMSFRLAIQSATMKVAFAQNQRDSLKIIAAFNTVDLPTSLAGLAASFSINGITSNANDAVSVSGVLNSDGVLQSPLRNRPDFQMEVIQKDQQLIVFVSKGNFAAALKKSGIVQGASGKFPVTFGLTIGAQTYAITEFLTVNASGSTSQGHFDLAKTIGGIDDGFFVFTQATALETLDGTSHFYEFTGLISEPFGKPIQVPTSGNWIFRFNAADPIVVPFDRINPKGTRVNVKRNGDLITIDQPERDLGGIRRLNINTVTRRISFNTWDILADANKGGSGLPLRGNPFIGFNFALRMDLDQPDGTTFSIVTATRLTRKTKDDVLWVTGRRLGKGN